MSRQSVVQTPTLNEDVRVTRNVPYGPAALQMLDIYSPKNGAGLPLVIFAHGGGWSKGDKAQHADKGNLFAENGVILISINYRLAPQVMHPLQIEDIASAFTWVKENAVKYGGNPDRIYLMGHSAGAHLVDLLATNDRFLVKKGLVLKNIQGVISLDTASLDLLNKRADDAPEGEMVAGMIETAFGHDPNVLRDASPTLSIHPGKVYPPFLMFCGVKRANAMAAHQEFAKAMKDAGGVVVVRPVSLSHRDINLAEGKKESAIFQESLELIKNPKSIKDR